MSDSNKTMWEQTKEYAQSAKDRAAEMFTGTRQDAAQEKDKAHRKGADVTVAGADKAKSAAATAQEKVGGGAGSTSDKARHKVQQQAEKTKSGAQEHRAEHEQSMLGAAADKTKSMASDASESLNRGWEATKDTLTGSGRSGESSRRS